MKKVEFLKNIYDEIIKNPDWYIDVINTTTLAFTQYKRGLDKAKSDVLMSLMFLTPSQARKIQKRMNRTMWNEEVQQAIDLRAENKGLSDL